MEINSLAVGQQFAPVPLIIDPRKITNFAAAVGDINPRYLDDLRDGPLAVHPSFSAVIAWQVVSLLRSQADFPIPVDIFNYFVHFDETINFQRQLHSGEEIIVTPELAAILPHRAGTLIVLQLTVTTADGVNIYVHQMTGLLRGVKCRDDGRGAENLILTASVTREQPLEWSTEIIIAPEAPYLYDGCAGIVAPIHTSPAAARRLGLPGIILQGTATLARAVTGLIDHEAGGDPQQVAVLAGRFSDFVFPGTTIRLNLLERVASDRQIELFFTVHNHLNNPAVSRGYLKLNRPGV
ncbi:MAG: MaoC/PaaZ C-terminal domain-containing protein [Candidatus Neomarinimicrobiota bacterium]